MTILLLSALAIGFTVATLVGCFAFPIGRALGVLDYPDPVGGRKRHDNVTPLVGGVAIMLTLVITLALLQFLSLTATQQDLIAYSWLTVVALGMFLVGFLDDRLHLSPLPRLVISIALFSTALSQVPGFALSFLYFSFFDKIHFLFPVEMVFTVICLVGLVNAINMADGKNGLVIGMALIWSILLYLNSSDLMSPIYAALSVTLIVLMYFNLKGRLFLGDGGSYGIAGFLGISSIYAYNQNFVHLSADQVALWFLIPVLDCLRLMISRMMVGRSPFSGDRNHLHHHLGHYFGWAWGLPVYLGAVALPAFISYLWPQTTLLAIAAVTIGYSTFMMTTAFRARKAGFATA